MAPDVQSDGDRSTMAPLASTAYSVRPVADSTVVHSDESLAVAPPATAVPAAAASADTSERRVQVRFVTGGTRSRPNAETCTRCRDRSVQFG
jgi:hypothetical protein